MISVTSPTQTLETLVAPADALRTLWLRIAGPWLRPVLVDRRNRVAFAVSLAIIASLVLTIVAPIGLLAIGPIVWGVPHLLADARYLVVRPGLHRRREVWFALGVPIAIAALTPWGVRAGLFAVLGAALVARGALLARRATLGTVSIAAIAVALSAPHEADLVFAHAHNVIALALLWAFRPAGQRRLVYPWVLFALATLLLLAGAFDGAVRHVSGWQTGTGMMLGPLLRTFAPFPAHLVFARRLLLAFAFAQSVHYAVWLRAIPDEARPGPTPRSFRQSVRALVRELGITLPVLTAIASIALAVWAVSDLVAARNGYLRFAVFHGHLEVAVAALLWAERRPL